jgi:hypothetical protein
VHFSRSPITTTKSSLLSAGSAPLVTSKRTNRRAGRGAIEDRLHLRC